MLIFNEKCNKYTNSFLKANFRFTHIELDGNQKSVICHKFVHIFIKAIVEQIELS